MIRGIRTRSRAGSTISKRLLDHLGLDRELTLVLHDWGGMIGMAYAARHPERIARLVVTNTAAFHLPASKPLPLALAFCRSSFLAAPLVRGANAFCHGTALIGCKRGCMPRDLRRAYVYPYDSWAHRIAILRFVQDIPLRPGDPSYDLVSWVQDRLHLLASRSHAHSLGHERLRLRPPFSGGVGAAVSRGRGASISAGGPLSLRGRSRFDQRAGAAVSRGPASHPGARRLSRTSLVTEPSNIAALLVAMAARKAAHAGRHRSGGERPQRPRSLHAFDLPPA